MERRVSHGLLLAVILVGWTLALFDLAEKSLWADEGYTAYLAQQADSQDPVAVLRRDHSPLHLFLVMGFVRLSRSEMALRFPSAMAAVLALPVVYLLGRHLFRWMTGLVGAFLLAISPFAVGYAQEARTYALLAALASLSLLLLLLALERKRWIWWAGFTVCTTLLLYTHFYAWFVVGAEVIFAFLLLLRAMLVQRRFDRRLVGLAVSLFVIAVLYLPWVSSLTFFWQEMGPGAQNLPPGLQAFELSAKFFRRMVIHFGPRAGGWRFYLFVGGLLVGLASLVVRRQGRTMLLLALFLVLPVVFLTFVPSKWFFEYRYLIFILPLFLLVVAEAVTVVTSLLTQLRGLARFRRLQPVLALGLACLLFVPANFPALQSHYRWEKENWRGIGRFIEAHLQSDEAIFVAPRYWAHPLLYYQPPLESYLVGGDTVEQLESAAPGYAGLWYVPFAAPLADPTGAMTQWITERDFELLIDGDACGHGIHVYYRRFDETAPRRQDELLGMAAEFCPADPRFQSPLD